MSLTLTSGFNAIAADSAIEQSYLIQPGDVLQISVWREENLDREVIVIPDGLISFPLIGEVLAAGKSIAGLRNYLSKSLSEYIPDPVVNVAISQLNGNRVYVLGKVNRPGAIQIVNDIDVLQALSIAGGTSTYAAVNKIRILRRNSNNTLSSLKFEYGAIEKGKNLEQNIILKSGDVVVVP